MKLRFHPLVISRDIPSLDTPIKRHVQHSIDEKLLTNPLLFGTPLRFRLTGMWKLRVGDWRVVYTIEKEVVSIILIAHRKEVYKLINKRM